MTMDPIIIAQATYEKAQEAQAAARKALDDFNTSIATTRKQFEEAKKALDAAKPTQQIIKANLQKAEADVTIARAELAKLAPEKVATGNGKGSNQSDVCAAVAALLKGAPAPLTNDEVFAGLQASGVEMGGSKPRENLSAYIARWSKVPASGIVSAGRDKWTSPDKAAVPEVPAFLQPTEAQDEKVEVPAFLAQVGEDVPDPEGATDLSSPLPDGFPGVQALRDAGFSTFDSLAGKTHDQLRRIKGVGAETARNILATLEA